MKWKEDGLVNCPFYIKDTNDIIVCEGCKDYPEANTVSYIKFKNKRLHMSKYCRRDYEQCPIYKDILLKYQK